MKKIYTATSLSEAHIVKGLLESGGIAAQVRGEALLGARGELPLVMETAPTVWILKTMDYHPAVAVIENYERNLKGEGQHDGSTWSCPRCGETLEPQFTACWKCGFSNTDQISDE